MKHSRRNTGRLLVMVLLICTMMMAFAPQGYAMWKGTHKDAIKGVVRVMALDDDTANFTIISTGSGFGVGKAGEETDIFVTNRHCVVDERSDSICKYVYILLEDGDLTEYFDSDNRLVDATFREENLIRCEVLYPKSGDPAFPDVAILRAERVVPERIALPLKSGFDMSSGDKVYTMGFPGTADDATKGERMSDGRLKQTVSSGTESVTVAEGIISRTVNPVEYSETTVFQHTAQMSRGNSGGPLVDEDGYVVGINTYGHQAYDGGAKVDNYFLSLYVDYAMQKLDELDIHYDKYGEDFLALYWPWMAGGAAALVAAVLVIKAIADRKKPKFRLQGVAGPFANRRFAIEGTLRLGKDPTQNDLIFPQEATTISRTHCKFETRGSELFLTDLDSKNGTYVNGNRLVPGQSCRVSPGDTVCLSNEGYRFQIDVAHHK